MLSKGKRPEYPVQWGAWFETEALLEQNDTTLRKAEAIRNSVADYRTWSDNVLAMENLQQARQVLMSVPPAMLKHKKVQDTINLGVAPFPSSSVKPVSARGSIAQFARLCRGTGSPCQFRAAGLGDRRLVRVGGDPGAQASLCI